MSKQLLYKLTNELGETFNGTKWGPGVSHSGTGEGLLCGPGWIHAYEHKLLGLFLNDCHAGFRRPRLWLAEGEVVLREGQLKCGCRTLTTIRELEVPVITPLQHIKFSILCVKQVYKDQAWNDWADAWLTGAHDYDSAAKTANTTASRCFSANSVIDPSDVCYVSMFDRNMAYAAYCAAIAASQYCDTESGSNPCCGIFTGTRHTSDAAVMVGSLMTKTERTVNMFALAEQAML